MPAQTSGSAAGQAAIVCSVPNQPGLLGAEIHCQGAFLDTLANPGGIAMSEAITLRLGGR